MNGVSHSAPSPSPASQCPYGLFLPPPHTKMLYLEHLSVGGAKKKMGGTYLIVIFKIEEKAPCCKWEITI